MLARELLLFLHLLAAAAWIGGMFTMLFAVRPALAQIDTPPLRLRVMVALLERLFAAVAVAIGVLLASGYAVVVLAGGWGAVRWNVHAMSGIALLMIVIFGYIRLGPFAQLRRAVAAAEWPAGAGRLALIRKLIALNLALGTAVFAVATIGRAG